MKELLRQLLHLIADGRCQGVSRSPGRCASSCWPGHRQPCCVGIALPVRSARVLDIDEVAKVPPDVGMKATGAGPQGQPMFDVKGPRLIHQRGALTDKPVPVSVKRLQINLLWRAHLNKSHSRLGRGLGSCGCAHRVGLVRLHTGLQ